MYRRNFASLSLHAHEWIDFFLLFCPSLSSCCVWDQNGWLWHFVWYFSVLFIIEQSLSLLFFGESMKTWRGFSFRKGSTWQKINFSRIEQCCSSFLKFMVSLKKMAMNYWLRASSLCRWKQRGGRDKWKRRRWKIESSWCVFFARNLWAKKKLFRKYLQRAYRLAFDL